MTEAIRNTIDNVRYGCGVFIDLKKAFDTVNHSVLLKKMEHYGIKSVALDWFASYLSYRKQFLTTLIFVVESPKDLYLGHFYS